MNIGSSRFANPHKARILELAQLGLSSRAIVERIWKDRHDKITRNVVIGLCRRNNIPLGDSNIRARNKEMWRIKKLNDFLLK